ncbi:hypothetical protein D9M68_424360 [compost metagenome]
MTASPRTALLARDDIKRDAGAAKACHFGPDGRWPTRLAEPFPSGEGALAAAK